MKLTLHEVAKIVDAQNNISDLDDVPLNQIEFDSRKITEGDLFYPLKARDGHDFIDLAFENGAVATFSEKELPGKPHLLVNDCLKAFQTLAQYYIDKMRVDVIAVTGSNGKTSTKDMISAVLSTTYKTYKTQEITIMRSDYPTPFSTCLKIPKKLFLRWDKTTWEIFIFSLKLQDPVLLF